MSSENINSQTTSDNKWPYISIIIPAFNESQYIEKTISSLRGCEYPKDKYEIIVVDNASTDNTFEISKKIADISIQLPTGNVGAVRNFGAKKSKGDILAFIDADCTVSKEWLHNIKILIQESKNSIFGGTCVLSNKKNWIEEYWLLGNPNKKQRDLVGASIAINRSLFFSLSGFNENITSGEDTELSNRARSKKINVEITPLLTVTHMGNAKTTREFIKRQIWHSENYFLDLKESFKDPTFILCMIALLLLSIAAFYSTHNIIYSLTNLLLFMSIVFIFSLKRMIYANFIPKTIAEFSKIYYLDFLYVISRIIGSIRSIFLLLKHHN